MIYGVMKNLIMKYNNQYESGIMTKEEYKVCKESNQRKLDVFYAGGRLTEAQYEELSGMWLEVKE